MKKKTKKESELTSGELARATGGVKNIDNPLVQTVFAARDKVLKDAKAATAELLRSQGGTLGSTHTL